MSDTPEDRLKMLNAILYRRRQQQGIVSRAKGAVTKHRAGTEIMTSGTITIHLGKLDSASNELNLICQELFAIETDMTDHDQVLETFTQDWEQAYAALLDIQGSISQGQSNSSSSTKTDVQNVSSSQIKLPKLELPTFDGNLHDWISFKNQFEQAVHLNTQISKVVKMNYLKSQLKGNAASLIQSFSITEAHYDEAWKLLEERYSHRREIIYAYLDQVFLLPNLTQETQVQLRKMIDTVNEVVRNLEILEQPIKHWDTILVYLLRKKLGNELRHHWELSQQKDEPPKLSEFIKFLDQRARALLSADNKDEKSKSSNGRHSRANVQQTNKSTVPHLQRSSNHCASVSVHLTNNESQCVLCKTQEHPLFKCPEFIKLLVPERWKIVKDNHHCFNCLRKGHSSKNCKGTTCKICNSRHHTMIHQDKQSSSTNSNPTNAKDVFITHSSVVNVNQVAPLSKQQQRTQLVMGTAIVLIEDSHGNFQECRVNGDSAAKVPIITERMVKILGLKRKHHAQGIYGVGSSKVATTKGAVDIHLKSRVNDFTAKFCALIVDTITTPQPTHLFEPLDTTQVKNLIMADPRYYKPGPIDMLLDLKLADQIWLDGQIKGPHSQYIIRNSLFGWIFSGEAPAVDPCVHLTILHTRLELSSTLTKFWEIEDLPKSKVLTVEEEACETHFESTHTRTDEGRYVVELPFKNQLLKSLQSSHGHFNSHRFASLGSSRQIAMKRFSSLERKFSKDPHLKEEYISYIRELQQLGMLEKVPPDRINIHHQEHCYIPHHPVKKESSLSTKIRPVNDASAKTMSGSSLNDLLCNGPNIQRSLLSIFLQFRTYIVAIIGDIKKFYPQSKVISTHADFQRILWRENPTEPIQDLRYTGITFGVGPAAYLAVKCLQQLSKDDGYKFPIAASALLNQFYIDDLISGKMSVAASIEFIHQLIALLKLGGFELCKIASSHNEVLVDIPTHLRANEDSTVGYEHIIKTLGIQWHPTDDVFTFEINSQPNYEILTRRIVLSEIAKIYDPLGWLSPVIIRRKLLMQTLWIEEHRDNGWDKPVPDYIAQEWLNDCENLSLLSAVKIPRRIISTSPLQTQLCGFCDASERAYAAVVYIRSIYTNGLIMVNLVAAKTRVAPLKKITLPHLELCAADLLSSLMSTINESLGLQIDEIHSWSDSTIVLCWISKSPHVWKTYVSNRVSNIQRNLPNCRWHHVSSQDNPADCASRGITASEFVTHHLWWNGPPWLMEPKIQNSHDLIFNEEAEREAAPLRVNLHLEIFEENIMHKYSSLSRLLIITSYVLRFIYYCQVRVGPKDLSPFSSTSLEDALRKWIKYVQQNSFPEELKLLQKCQSVPIKSSLASLSPFLDSWGIIRVGGRLLQSKDVNEDVKHPILLPKKHFLVTLIIRDCHVNNFHCSAKLLLSSLRQKYWILCGAEATSSFVKKCILCLRFRPPSIVPIMGSLPAPRVTASSPFLHTGIDYAGPIMLKLRNGRGAPACQKGYIAVFVCFSTKAMHLEVVSSLSTSAFLATLRRFVARRGKPSDIYSDNGPNFKGADRVLGEMLRSELPNNHFEKIQRDGRFQSIRWHFNPPIAPHFGGLWEAAVKSTKQLLKKFHIDGSFTFEEMSTILSQIESCLNSRPLCQLSNDPNDLQALTPGHFLIGRPLNSVPDSDPETVKWNKLDRWISVQAQVHHFWNRWRLEYLSELQRKSKWTRSNGSIAVGTVVVMKDHQLPPAHWKLGIVSNVHPGVDGIVRAVTVKILKKEYRRPVNQICPLPVNDD